MDDQGLQVGKTELQSLLVSSDNDLRVHAVFDEAFGVLEEFSSQNGNCSGAE